MTDTRCFYPFHFDTLLKNSGTSAQLDLRRDATRYKDSIPDFSLCFKGHFPQKTKDFLWEKLPLQLCGHVCYNNVELVYPLEGGRKCTASGAVFDSAVCLWKIPPADSSSENTMPGSRSPFCGTASSRTHDSVCVWGQAPAGGAPLWAVPESACGCHPACSPLQSSGQAGQSAPSPVVGRRYLCPP